MSRKTIPAIMAIASILHISSAQAQDCPDLGASGPEICVVASAGTTGPLIFRGPSPLVVGPMEVIGDYTVTLVFTLTQSTGLSMGVMGMVTKTGTENTTISLTAHGGLSDVPIGEGVTALNLVGTATGTSLIQLGGGAGFDIGVGEPLISPVLGSISAAVQNNTGLPVGFGDVNPGEPVEAGAVSVAVTLAVNINDVGTIVMIPASAGVGPDGLTSDEPLGGETEILRLQVDPPDGPFERFPMDQFFAAGPDECDDDHYHPMFAFAESIEGSELADPDPGACGYGTPSTLTMETIDLVAEDTTLTEDLTVPDGQNLVIAPDVTLTIPEGLAAYVSGEVVVLGTLVVDGELLNSDGGVLANMGDVIVGGLIVNNPDALITNDAGATISNTSNTITNYGTIDNHGTIDNTGRITNEPGGTVTGDGIVTGEAIVQIEDLVSDAEGGCCLSEVSCSVGTEADCDAQGGTYLGDDSACIDDTGDGASVCADIPPPSGEEPTTTGGAPGGACGACGSGTVMAMIACVGVPFIRHRMMHRRRIRRNR